MIRLSALAFVLAIASSAASSAQAMPIVPIQQPESIFSQVREACGAGFTRVNGVCVRTPARAAARRGAVRNKR